MALPRQPYDDGTRWKYYTADVVSTQDYYAFGQGIEERGFSRGSSKYRYSYNGKETDDETGIQDYGFRMYDSRLCRFLSVDPLAPKYPELTTYQFASNRPIDAIDEDGLEAHVLTQEYGEDGKIKSSSLTWDEKAAPVKDGQLPYIEIKGGKESRTIEYAKNIKYEGGNLTPTEAPNSIIGTTQYYKFRQNNYYIRHQLMDNYFNCKFWTPNAPKYYIGYGDKYANRFYNELRPHLTVDGQEWLVEALLNLQTAIETELKRNPSIEINNSAFQQFAFDSHVKAYEDAGLFSLPYEDMLMILKTPDISDLISPKALTQVVKITNDYVGYAKKNPISTAVKVLEFGYRLYRRVTKNDKKNDDD
jgi:RHS repeat-associated protein